MSSWDSLRVRGKMWNKTEEIWLYLLPTQEDQEPPTSNAEQIFLVPLKMFVFLNQCLCIYRNVSIKFIMWNTTSILTDSCKKKRQELEEVLRANENISLWAQVPQKKPHGNLGLLMCFLSQTVILHLKFFTARSLEAPDNEWSALTKYIRLAKIHWTSSISTSSTCMNFRAIRKASRDNWWVLSSKYLKETTGKMCYWEIIT